MAGDTSSTPYRARSGQALCVGAATCAATLLLSFALASVAGAADQEAGARPGTPYGNMPSVAPIGVRPDRYLPVPEKEVPYPVEPAKGYRLQQLGRGLHMVTDNAYQSLFMVHDKGVIVIDAPPAFSARLRDAIREVTDRPVTHILYSHSHIDHIGGVKDLGESPVVIAHDETRRLLEQASDPKRPVPSVTFKDRYRLDVGGQLLELSYHGVGHEPGNIFIYAPEQKVLMVVDVIFPGWMPWRRFALAKDVGGYFRQVEAIERMPFESFVGGHVSRVGTRADVRLQLDFMNDLKAAAATALKTTELGAEMDPRDKSNPWAVFDNYIDRVAAQCVGSLTPKWSSRLAAFDVYIWDQCYAMEQSLRID